jgi:hypothetical protein
MNQSTGLESFVAQLRRQESLRILCYVYYVGRRIVASNHHVIEGASNGVLEPEPVKSRS